jgi:RNA polymerase sigma factor (sigma-70 family)
MAKAQQASALRHVELLFNAGTTIGLSDRQLLERFLDQGDGPRNLAFAALIERHGPMVRRVCRSILRSEHAADDAFQATFLILIRRAGSLWVQDSIGPWLHQVAYRVAYHVQSTEARRRRHERRAASSAHPVQHDQKCDDLGTALHQEIARLPERDRAPIVLCCLEGMTQQKAAGQLGLPLGTLQSRLARGRERLRGRLIRRGLTPAMVLSTTAFSADGTSGAISSSLVAGTIDAAMEFSAVKVGGAILATSSLSSLTNGVLTTMFLHDLKLMFGALVAVMVAAAGVGVWARQETKVTAVKAPEQVTRIEESIPVNEIDQPATEELSNNSDAAEIPSSLKYGDGQADGKKSIGGSGELIEFTGAAAAVKVAGVRIHGSRYGQAQAPQESFLIYFLNNDMSRILHTEMAPYSLMERGTEEWVEISFERPVDLPKTFWVALDFRATQTKGVYLSFDTSTGGKHSRVGLPGARTSKVTFGGDWMIEATLAK